MVDGTPRRQVVGKQFPGAAAADGVTDAINDLASGVLGRPAARLGGRDERLQILPLGIGDVTVVRLARFHLDSLAKPSFSNALLISKHRLLAATRSRYRSTDNGSPNCR